MKFLNQQNLFLYVALLFASISGATRVVQAQNQASPEAVAIRFASYLINPPQPRYTSYQGITPFTRSAPVSGLFTNKDVIGLKQHLEMYFPTEDKRHYKPLAEYTTTPFEFLLMKMQKRLKEQHLKTRLLHTDARQARVQVESEEINHPHDVVLVCESNTWKVDVTATSTAWDKEAPYSQSSTMSPPEKVVVSFMTYLSQIADMPRNSDVYFHFTGAGPISQKSFRASNVSFAFLIVDTADLLDKPHYKTSVLRKDNQNAHIKIVRDEKAQSREVVLIREKNAWKVDVLATYAAWNKMTEAQAIERIHEIHY